MYARVERDSVSQLLTVAVQYVEQTARHLIESIAIRQPRRPLERQFGRMGASPSQTWGAWSQRSDVGRW